MAQSTLETMFRGESMAKESIHGRMVLSTQDNGLRTRFMVKVYTSGSMGDAMMENGRTIICMVMEYTHGKMVAVTRDNTSKIESMATEFTPGLMAESMKETGRMVDSTEKANIG